VVLCFGIGMSAFYLQKEKEIEKEKRSCGCGVVAFAS
jgi:hypothetical protein